MYGLAVMLSIATQTTRKNIYEMIFFQEYKNCH